MKREEIENAVALAENPETEHEDARDWYGSYGWHLTTDSAGDVELQTVEYDWLDNSCDSVVARLRARDERLSADEAERIAEMANEIRNVAQQLDGCLIEAVERHREGDLDGCRVALLEAWSIESEHGDVPATQSLAGELLVAAPAGE